MSDKAYCSCKCIGDCPVDKMSHDGSSGNGLCTADELREQLKLMMAGQELLHWRKRAMQAERKLQSIMHELERTR